LSKKSKLAGRDGKPIAAQSTPACVTSRGRAWTRQSCGASLSSVQLSVAYLAINLLVSNVFIGDPVLASPKEPGFV
jgi:hypothetical protein